ncbi:MAG TPA: hypothetical protein PLG99_02665 [Kaistiaceae bacterium]|nr:hypothetical protein [Kaistiaceae bacterium]
MVGTNKIKDYLSSLSPDARRMLVRGIEDARSRGENDPSHDLILSIARESFAGSRSEVTRINTAKRLFFTPVETHLITETLPHKQRGRIHRSSLDHIWKWIERDLAQERIGPAIAAIEQAAAIGDEQEIETATRVLRARFLAVAREYMAALLATPDGHRRLAGHLGGQRVLDDLGDLVDLLESERALTAFTKALPERLTLERRDIEKALQAFAMFVRVEPAKTIFALIVILERFDPRQDFLRFIVEAVGSDDLAAVAKSDYAQGIDLALTEIARLIERFTGLQRTSENREALQDSIRQYHRWVRTLEVAFEVQPTSEWGKHLAETRSTMSNRVATIVEPTPQIVRRALRTTRVNGVLPKPDEATIEEALVHIALLDAAIAGRDSLALNRMLPDVRKNLEQVVDTMVNGLIGELKTCGEADRATLAEYASFGVTIASAVFGEDYAALIHRARQNALSQSAAR